MRRALDRRVNHADRERGCLLTDTTVDYLSGLAAFASGWLQSSASLPAAIRIWRTTKSSSARTTTTSGSAGVFRPCPRTRRLPSWRHAGVPKMSSPVAAPGRTMAASSQARDSQAATPAPSGAARVRRGRAAACRRCPRRLLRSRRSSHRLREPRPALAPGWRSRSAVAKTPVEHSFGNCCPPAARLTEFRAMRPSPRAQRRIALCSAPPVFFKRLDEG
jgi:hypothetical protein